MNVLSYQKQPQRSKQRHLTQNQPSASTMRTALQSCFQNFFVTLSSVYYDGTMERNQMSFDQFSLINLIKTDKSISHFFVISKITSLKQLYWFVGMKNAIMLWLLTQENEVILHRPIWICFCFKFFRSEKPPGTS